MATGYTRPGSTVEIIETDHSASGAAPALPGCIVGPGFQVIVEGMAGPYDSSDGTDWEYGLPSLISTSIVDEDTVEVFIRNAVDGEDYPVLSDGGSNWEIDSDQDLIIHPGLNHRVSSGSTGGPSTTGPAWYFTDVWTDFGDLTLEPGDILAITGTLPEDTYEIAGVDGTELVLASNYTSGAGAFWEIRRPLVGTVFVSYRALRTDIVRELLYAGSIDELIVLAGSEEALIPENPLYFGMYLALSEGEAAVYGTGVEDLDGYKDEADSDLVAWSVAFTFLKDYKYIYGYALCTENAGVIGLGQVFVDWMSNPQNSAFSVMHAGCKEIIEDVAVTTQTAGRFDLGVPGGPGTYFDDPTWVAGTSGFLAYGCRVGGYVEITPLYGAVLMFRVKEVYSDHVVLYADSSLGGQTGLTWRFVNDYYNSAQQATVYGAYAESFGDKRVRLAWPSRCMMESFSTTVEYPSYFFGCIRVGKVAGATNPSQPYTRDEVSTITRVMLPFRDDDLLDTVAAGGMEIFFQERSALPVHSRHQLTTDMTFDARKEQSVVTQVDHAGRDFKYYVDRNVGKFVMNTDLKNALKTAITSRGNYLVRKLHSIASFRLLYLKTSETDVSRVAMAVRLGLLYPYNGADLIVYV